MLGTLAALRQHSRACELQTLARIVKVIQPDLLCAEITREQWINGDFERLAAEYREVLIPACRRSDIVLVPVGAPEAATLVAPRGGRWLARRLRKEVGIEVVPFFQL